MQKTLKHYPLPTEDSTPEAVILANGNFPTHEIPLALLKKTKHIICCDGAANEYFSKGFTPQVIVGDGDSLSQEIKAKFANIIYYSSDTQTNDLTKAVEYCVSQRLTRVVIVGASGKREDHTIGNIGLLIEYMDKFEEVEIITDHGVFTPIRIDSSFESYAGQAVSVFSFKSTPVRSRGLQYPLSAFTNWWQGTLNTAKSNQFTILARDKVIIYRVF